MEEPGYRDKWDMGPFRFEPSLPASKPAANDAESAASTANSAQTVAEMWVNANKTAIDIVGGLNAQFWTLVLICNPPLALISSLMWPKNKPRGSE